MAIVYCSNYLFELVYHKSGHKKTFTLGKKVNKKKRVRLIELNMVVKWYIRILKKMHLEDQKLFFGTSKSRKFAGKMDRPIL